MLGKIVIPASVGAISSLCFQNCIKLEEVIFNQGSTVNVINFGTFENCMKLETIKLWRRVQNIRTNAFKNCLSLQKFDGSYIQYYHDCAFANCTNLREVNVDIDVIIQITADTFFGCIFPMLKLTFSDDMEELLSQLPNRPLYWLCQGSTNSDVMDSMMKIVQFLSKEDMPRRLMTMKTRSWGS